MASKSNSYDHILKYTGLFGGVQGLNILISLVRNKLVALLLGPDGMGFNSLLVSIANFISQATNFGLPFSAVRNVSQLYEDGDEAQLAHYVRVVRLWAVMTALLGMLLCMLAGPLLNAFTFSWGDHTLHFIVLAPAVGMTAISACETALLKGTRQLRPLAIIQVSCMTAALFISVPVYWWFGQTGVVPVIVGMAGVTMAFTLHHSLRVFPLRRNDFAQTMRHFRLMLGAGSDMVRLGLAFTVAGIMGSGAEMLVRSYLNVHSDLDVVGLYNAGFMICITYAGIVFSSLESDYYPRLSAIAHSDYDALRMTVNRQTEVTLLIVAPMMALLITLLPVVVPLLFSSKFAPVISMAQVAALSIYFKAMALPIEYIPLARGDSRSYMMLETLYDVMMVALVIGGYHVFGLWGTGLGLTLSYALNIIVVYLYTRWRYSYRMSMQVLRYAVMQITLGIGIWCVTMLAEPWMRYVFGLLLCAVSIFYSASILRSKTSLWQSLADKFQNRLKR